MRFNRYQYIFLLLLGNNNNNKLTHVGIQSNNNNNKYTIHFTKIQLVWVAVNITRVPLWDPNLIILVQKEKENYRLRLNFYFNNVTLTTRVAYLCA